METEVTKTCEKKKKVRISGYIALVIFLAIFSGLLKNIPYLSAFDLQAMIGKFGTIGETGKNFMGAGGIGADQGFMLVISLLPTVMLCMGLVEVASHYGALEAAGQIFTPFLKPLLGLKGSTMLSILGSLNSSDVGSHTARELYDKGEITDEERAKLIAFQLPSCGMINNLILCLGLGAGILKFSFVGYMVILLALKVISSNIVRLWIVLIKKREAKKTNKEAAQ